MKRNILLESERKVLKAQHKKERDKRVCDRIKAVLLYDAGWDIDKISEALLISEQSVRNHIDDYQQKEKLKPENGGSVSKLTPEQSKSLIAHLEEHTYLNVGEIVAYVQSTFGVTYTDEGMRSWLKNNDFSYKKPSLVPGKADKEAQENWIKEYEILKAKLQPDEAIVFADGVHPTHNVQLGYGWIRTGYRKEIPSNTGRKRLNISGVIDIANKKLITREDETLNSETTIAFLKKIEEVYPLHNRIYFICDNARYYRSKAVQEHLEGSKIEMHFLPPYSPNLNPIERLWKILKKRVTCNKYYKEFKGFRDAVFGFFEKITKGKETIWSTVTDKFKALDSHLVKS